MKTLYIIGSLRNPNIPEIGVKLRELGFDVFDDWYAPGPEADDYWKHYETSRGRTYEEALQGWAGKHIFEFDKHHIDRSDIGVLIAPAGKSAHLELGYMIGQGKKGYILLDDPDRWDVMYQFADGIFFNFESLIKELKTQLPKTKSKK